MFVFKASVLSRVLATKGLVPSQLSAIAVQPVRIAKMPRLSEPIAPIAPVEPEDHQFKLMECQNKRKADKRKSMGLPPLKPYYCKDFDTVDCFFRYSQSLYVLYVMYDCIFSSIYWASMRRHFESKHSNKKLKLPKDEDRHPCSCGRTFLEPNRLQEHMIAAKHEFKYPKTSTFDDDQDDQDDHVIDWQDMVE